MIIEAIVIGVPGIAFWLVYIATDSTSRGALVLAAVLVVAAVALLLFYVITQRVMPLRRELERLRGMERIERGD